MAGNSTMCTSSLPKRNDLNSIMPQCNLKYVLMIRDESIYVKSEFGI